MLEEWTCADARLNSTRPNGAHPQPREAEGRGREHTEQTGSERVAGLSTRARGSRVHIDHVLDGALTLGRLRWSDGPLDRRGNYQPAMPSDECAKKKVPRCLRDVTCPTDVRPVAAQHPTLGGAGGGGGRKVGVWQTALCDRVPKRGLACTEDRGGRVGRHGVKRLDRILALHSPAATLARARQTGTYGEGFYRANNARVLASRGT